MASDIVRDSDEVWRLLNLSYLADGCSVLYGQQVTGVAAHVAGSCVHGTKKNGASNLYDASNFDSVW